MGVGRLLGVSVLAAFAAIVGCSSSDGGSDGAPRIDLKTCIALENNDSACSTCCSNAGFNSSGPAPDSDKCACNTVSEDDHVCASQASDDSCNSCCNGAGYSDGFNDSATHCECFDKVDAASCAASDPQRSGTPCVECCNEHGYLFADVGDGLGPPQCVCF